MQPVREILNTLGERRDLACEILGDIPGLRCYRPQATFYLYPNVTDLMRRKGTTDYEEFRRRVLRETGVAFCTRLHFGRPFPGEAERYIRLAYSGINLADIDEGLSRFKAWCR
jgi:aspartate/methionine/tyrosine aminotransferase